MRSFNRPLLFKPTARGAEEVDLNLSQGRTTLVFLVKANFFDRIAEDKDRLVFIEL
jgi:hypothetical protein